MRVATRIEIAKLKEQMADTTMIYVTHDQVEAMTLADRIVVLSGGKVEQVGAPLELYERPANLFVAKFIGSPAMNILPAKIEESGGQTVIRINDGERVALDIDTPSEVRGGIAHLGVRPEDLTIVEGEGAFLFEGTVTLVEALGEVTLLYVDVAGTNEPVTVKIPGIVAQERGKRLRFTAPQSKLHLFDDQGQSFR